MAAKPKIFTIFGNDEFSCTTVNVIRLWSAVANGQRCLHDRNCVSLFQAEKKALRNVASEYKKNA